MREPLRKRDVMRSLRIRRGSEVLILLVLFLVVVPVAGQGLPEGQGPVSPEIAYPGLPSANIAFGLSVAGTVAAIASMYSGEWHVAWTGTTFGPSLGFFYAGCWGRGLLSAGLRFGVNLALVLNYDHSDSWGLVWLVGLAGSAILDMATVKRAVLRRNECMRARRGLQLDLSPFAVPKGGGVRLQMSF
jgi:hypothetical protein